MKKRLIIVTLSVVALCTFTSCKKENDELAKYKEACDTFYQVLSKEDLAITKISKDNENYSKELLTELDNLEMAFENFANVPVPEEFSRAEYYADTACDNMSKAVSMYHEAFESEPFNSSLAQNAGEYYDTALEYVNYIGEVLQGENPATNDVMQITD